MTTSPSTVRERTWLWVQQTGTFNDARWKVPGTSHATGDQACKELGVPNAIFIQWEGRPQPPFLEHAQGCAAARRLMWTAVNNCGGRASLAETEHFFELARAMPTITGAFLDDFLCDAVATDLTPGSVIEAPAGEVPAALTVAELATLQQRLHDFPGRSLELGAVVYTRQLRPEIAPNLRHCDILSLWTSKSQDLASLPADLAHLRRLAPGKRIWLGLYLYDFGNERPMPLDAMELQCRLALEWLEAGSIEGIILLSSNLCGRDLDAVDYARRWMAEVGDRPLPPLPH